MPGDNRYAFTLLEVLLSIVILFSMGLALIKFDTWITTDLHKQIEKAKILYTNTPFLYSRVDLLKNRSISLRNITYFQKLRDDEIFWLDSIETNIRVGKSEIVTLYESEDATLAFTLYPLWIQRGDTSIEFVKVQP